MACARFWMPNTPLGNTPLRFHDTLTGSHSMSLAGPRDSNTELAVLPEVVIWSLLRRRGSKYDRCRLRPATFRRSILAMSSPCRPGNSVNFKSIESVALLTKYQSGQLGSESGPTAPRYLAIDPCGSPAFSGRERSSTQGSAGP